ncbi:MAG: cold-shock protein [Hyphomonadaceae bacterium]
MIGAVVSYDGRRGAIAPDAGGDAIAVFASEVERAGFAGLARGDRLSFDVKSDRALGRTFAVNLRRL